MIGRHLEYIIRELPATHDALRLVAALHHEVLPSRLHTSEDSRAKFLDELVDGLNGREHLALAAFTEEDQPVAYKLGYLTGNRHERFYSWLGGVHPFHRRKGLARALLRAQHEWARERGIRTIETQARGDNPGMLILNLQEGFHALGSIYALDQPGVRIILRKPLQ
ncbi:MAG: GNAT family N-acetyltransferase [Planctomycetota bacterium]